MTTKPCATLPDDAGLAGVVAARLALAEQITGQQISEASRACMVGFGD
jgi:hypothetical protein